MCIAAAVAQSINLLAKSGKMEGELKRVHSFGGSITDLLPLVPIFIINFEQNLKALEEEVDP
jgi:hypothetical protein